MALSDRLKSHGLSSRLMEGAPSTPVTLGDELNKLREETKAKTELLLPEGPVMTPEQRTAADVKSRLSPSNLRTIFGTSLDDQGISLGDSVTQSVSNYTRFQDQVPDGMSFAEMAGREFTAGIYDIGKSLIQIPRYIWKGSAKLTDFVAPITGVPYDPDSDKLMNWMDTSLEAYDKTINHVLDGVDSADIGSLGKITAETFRAIPPILASAILSGGAPITTAAGGYAMGTETATMGKTITSTMQNLNRMKAFGLISGAGYAEQAEKAGATFGQSVAMGIYGGAGEVATEIIPLGFALDFAKSLKLGNLAKDGAEKVAKKYGVSIFKYLKTMLAEGTQEAIMSPYQRAASASMGLDTDEDLFNAKEILRDFYGGVALSVILSAMAMPVMSSSYKMASKIIEEGGPVDVERVDELKDTMASEGVVPSVEKINDPSDRLSPAIESSVKESYNQRLKAVEKAAYESTVANGGVTIDLRGNQPSEGYAVALPEYGEIVPSENFNQDVLDEFVQKNLAVLQNKENHIGTWFNEEDGNVYIDISRVRPPTPETIEAAKQEGEIAVFDLANFEDIRTGVTEEEQQAIRSPQKIYYRGTTPGDTRRISTGRPEWDNNLFVSKEERLARFYGKTIEEVVPKPSAKIIMEGTPEFNKIFGRKTKNMFDLDWMIAGITKAKAQGVDIVEFQRQGDVGTVILNEESVVRHYEERRKRAETAEDAEIGMEEDVEDLDILEGEKSLEKIDKLPKDLTEERLALREMIDLDMQELKDRFDVFGVYSSYDTIDGQPVIKFEGKNWKTGEKVDEQFPIEYAYRAVSEEELQSIINTGVIKSNQSMNIGYEVEQGLTVYKHTDPSWYLPEEGGYVIKVKIDPNAGFFYDPADEYLKTAQAIPSSAIEEINGQKVSFKEREAEEPIPEFAKPIPESGSFAAVKTNDGQIFFDEENPTHVQLIQKYNIPPERIVSGGWIENGIYEETFQSDTMKYVESEKAKKRLEQKKAKRAAERKALSDSIPAEIVEEADEALILAEEKRDSFSRLLDDISGASGVEIEILDAGVKSLKSAAEKVNRKRASGKDYSAYDMKDHVRGAFIIKDFAQCKDVVEAAIEYAVENSIGIKGKAMLLEEMNEFGYKGFHLLVDMGEGITGEIQIHSEEGWNFKKTISDPIYKQWRNVAIDQAPQEVRDVFNQQTKMTRAAWDKIVSPLDEDAKIYLTEKAEEFGKVEPQKVIPEPMETEKDYAKPRAFQETAVASQMTETELKKRIVNNPEYYNPMTNEEQLLEAQRIVDEDLGAAESLVTNEDKRFGSAFESAIAYRVVERLQEMGEWDRALRVIESTARKFTTAGQMVQSAQIWNTATPAGMVNYMDKIIAKANEQIKDKKGKIVLTDEEKQGIYQRMQAVKEIDNAAMRTYLRDAGLSDKQINDLTSGELQSYNTALVMRDVINKIPISLARKISTYQAIAHLVNVKTMARNILGNSFFATTETVTKLLALPVDRMMAARTGKRTVGLPAFVNPYKEAVRRAKMTALDIKLGVQTQGGGKYDLFRGQTFEKGIMNKFEKTLSYGLRVPDEFFKGFIETDSLHQQVRARVGDAADEMTLDELRNVATAAEAEQAALEARYATFQDDSLLAQMFVTVKDTANKIGIGQRVRGQSGAQTKEFGLGDFIIKYTRVPANLISRAVEYTPLGYLRMIKLVGEAKTSNINQREAVLALTRPATGMGMIAMAAWLAAQGLIISEDKDRPDDARALDRAEGLGNYKINVTAIGRILDGMPGIPMSGDILMSYNWAEPVSTTLAIGAALNTEANKANTPIKAAMNIIGRSSEEMLDIPTLTVIQSMFYEGMRTDSSPFTIAAVPIAEGASGFVPAPVRQFAQYTDPTYRSTRGETALGTLRQKLIGSLPGTRTELEAMQDPWGEPRRVVGGIGPAFLSPSTITEYLPSPVTAQLKILEDATGESKHYPARQAPKTITHNKEPYKLTDSERAEYQRIAGGLIRDKYNELLDGVNVSQFSQEKAMAYVDRLAEIERTARSTARITILKKRLGVD